MSVFDSLFLKKLEQLPFVEAIWVFGSRARNDNSQRSDLDLAILCPQASEQEWQQVLNIIENADTLLKIDCVRFDKLKSTDKFTQNILKFKKIVYQQGSEYMDKIVWRDSFESLGAAITRLEEIMAHPDLDTIDYLQDAAIQRFEFTIELFWKILKKFLAYEKIDATTPRDVLSKAFQFTMIDDEQIWLSMLDDRNKTSHVYKEEVAYLVFTHIKNYCFVLRKTFDNLKIRFYQQP